MPGYILISMCMCVVTLKVNDEVSPKSVVSIRCDLS